MESVPLVSLLALILTLRQIIQANIDLVRSARIHHLIIAGLVLIQLIWRLGSLLSLLESNGHPVALCLLLTLGGRSQQLLLHLQSQLLFPIVVAFRQAKVFIILHDHSWLSFFEEHSVWEENLAPGKQPLLWILFHIWHQLV